MIGLFMSVAALAAAQPAAKPRCELRGIPAVDLVALRVAILDQAQHGTPRPEAATATMTAIETKAVACNKTKNAAAETASAGIAASRLVAETIAEKLAADGVDMAKVAGVVEKTDGPVLEALVARKTDAAGVDELRERVMAVAGADPSEETRRLLGAYTVNAARARVGAPAAAVAGPVETVKPKAPVER